MFIFIDESGTHQKDGLSANKITTQLVSGQVAK